MPFKPNYNLQRSERNRLKAAKKQDRLLRREEAAAERKAAREPGDTSPDSASSDGDAPAGDATPAENPDPADKA